MNARGSRSSLPLVSLLFAVAAFGATGPSAAQQRPGEVTIDFQDAELRAVIAALAEAGGLNVIYSDLPARLVTLRTNAPVARADVPDMLRSLAASNGLRVIEEAGLLRIEVDPALQAQGQPGAAAPQGEAVTARLWVYRLKHARAEELSQTIGALFGGGTGGYGGESVPLGLSQALRQQQIAPFTGEPPPQAAQPPPPPAGAGSLQGQLQAPVQIVPDRQTNSLLVRALEADWEVVRGAIDALDLRPLQVLIEVLIAEVRRSRLDDVGISVSVPDQRDSDTGAIFGGQLRGTSTGDFALRVKELGKVNADVLISALSAKSDVTVLSRPVVFVQNNQLARILVGSERPFIQVLRSLPTDNAVRDQIIQYRDVGTALTIRPTINPDGYVSLEVLQEVSTATAETQFGAPVISTREAQTHLLVRDGQTIVIGGLMDQQTESSRSGVPLLKDIPVIGLLFGSTRSAKVSTELFLFITPHIAATDEDAERIRTELEAATRDVGKRIERRTLVVPPDSENP